MGCIDRLRRHSYFSRSVVAAPLGNIKLALAPSAHRRSSGLPTQIQRFAYVSPASIHRMGIGGVDADDPPTSNRQGGKACQQLVGRTQVSHAEIWWPATRVGSCRRRRDRLRYVGSDAVSTLDRVSRASFITFPQRCPSVVRRAVEGSSATRVSPSRLCSTRLSTTKCDRLLTVCRDIYTDI